MLPAPFSADQGLLGTRNLRRLYALRNIAILGQVAAVLTAVFGFGINLPLLPMGAIIAALAVANLLTRRRLESVQEVSDREFFGQLLLDVGALTGLLHFSGGAANPFVWLFLLPLTIAATVLRPFYTRVLAAVTACCYTALMVAYVPLPGGEAVLGTRFELHVIGMWAGFMLSAGLIAYFVARMASTLRERDRVLAAEREKALRDERLIALGTLAAGAAHELGTPLSIMATLAREMERECSASAFPDLRSRLAIFRCQIDRCKETLALIAASAGDHRAEEGRAVPLDRYLTEVFEQWRTLRRSAALRPQIDGSFPAPRVIGDHTLAQALTTILNNAADASPQAVEMRARWDAHELVVEIADRGEGLSASASASAGKRVFTSKEQGLGLGLYLAHAAVARLGGHVDLFQRQGGGTRARVVLPLQRLLASPAPGESLGERFRLRARQ